MSSIVKIILIIKGAPLIAFAWTVIFDSFVLSLGFLYFYFKTNINFNFKRLKFCKKTAYNLLKDSWPLIFGSIAASIYMQIDQVMIKEMLEFDFLNGIWLNI